MANSAPPSGATEEGEAGRQGGRRGLSPSGIPNYAALQTSIVHYLGENLDFISAGQVVVTQEGAAVDVSVFGNCSAILGPIAGYVGELVELLNLELGLGLTLSATPSCESEVIYTQSPPPPSAPPPWLLTPPPPPPRPRSCPPPSPSPLPLPPPPAPAAISSALSTPDGSNGEQPSAAALAASSLDVGINLDEVESLAEQAAAAGSAEEGGTTAILLGPGAESIDLSSGTQLGVAERSSDASGALVAILVSQQPEPLSSPSAPPASLVSDVVGVVAIGENGTRISGESEVWPHHAYLPSSMPCRCPNCKHAQPVSFSLPPGHF